MDHDQPLVCVLVRGVSLWYVVLYATYASDRSNPTKTLTTSFSSWSVRSVGQPLSPRTFVICFWDIDNRNVVTRNSYNNNIILLQLGVILLYTHIILYYTLLLLYTHYAHEE